MYSLTDFMQEVEKSEGVICYGAGKGFERCIDCFKDTVVLSKIIGCVDRNKKLHGKKIDYFGKKIEVFPVESLEYYKQTNVILLITNALYSDVISDLSERSLLQGMHYYCFSHVYGMMQEEESMRKIVPKNIRRANEPIIPKIIHYCWFGHNPIPDRYKRWMESWQKYCPDYEIKEWNEDNYDITQNSYMYDAYKNKKWGFVPDYARLDIIYKHGGIYLDTDVELVNGLDDMLYQKGFAGFENDRKVAFGLGFGAVKELPVIKILRDSYNDLTFVNLDGTLNLTPSPVYQTKALLKMGLQENGEYQIIDDFVVYPQKVFCGKNPYSKRVIITPDTKAIHHYDASWADDDWRKRAKQLELEMNS